MRKNQLITVNEFCDKYNVDVSFVRSLQNSGLIDLITVEETTFFNTNQLHMAEKYIRFYYDMDINLQGIETITYLLQRISDMNNEINSLRNRLCLYENNITNLKQQ